MGQTKTCATCKLATPLENMGKSKRSKDGYNSYCKPCLAKASKIARDKDIEKNRAAQASYLKRNKAKINEKKLARYYAQKDRLLEVASVRRARDPEAVRAIERASYQRNKDRRRPIKNANQSIRNRLIGQSPFKILPKELARIVNGQCIKCGTHDRISIDHIIPLARGGRHSIGNLQPLCVPCNSSKNDRTMIEWKLALKGRDSNLTLG